ncbi:MAG: threonine/serine exporter family protein [Oscillospiraceae bacterium]|nr:threonine/serine exporter family protein [Oscillospiraceae bacterium]
MNPFVQILMGGLGTLGFNVLFHLRGRKLLLATLGGVISWAVFLALEPLVPGEAMRYFLATAVVTVYGEILARVKKTPTTTFLVPSVIPLIPGGALYHTMNYALNKQWSAFAHQAFYTLQLALALAVGIIAITTLTRLITAARMKRKLRSSRHVYHHSIH